MINWFDILSILLVLIGTAVGALAGLLGTIALLIFFVLAIWTMQMVFTFPVPVSFILFSLNIVFLIVLFVSVVILLIMFKPRKKYLHIGNRALGVLFGAGLSILIVGTVVLPFARMLPKDTQESVYASTTFTSVIPWSQDFLPGIQGFVIQKVNGFIDFWKTGSNEGDEAEEDVAPAPEQFPR
jgi:uncharacterized membrane protein required for colicin V production